MNIWKRNLGSKVWHLYLRNIGHSACCVAQTRPNHFCSAPLPRTYRTCTVCLRLWDGEAAPLPIASRLRSIRAAYDPPTTPKEE